MSFVRTLPSNSFDSEKYLKQRRSLESISDILLPLKTLQVHTSLEFTIC